MPNFPARLFPRASLLLVGALALACDGQHPEGLGSDEATTFNGGNSSLIAGLTISPASATVAAGGTVTFTPQGWNAGANTPVWTPVTWTATGGTINADGVYTAGSTAGSFEVVAASTTTNKTERAAVTITGSSAVINSIILTPATAALATGATKQFTVSAQLSNGTTQANPPVTWSATGGTISTAGLYTAATAAGTFRVIARSANGKADTSAVTLSAATVTGITLTPATVSLASGATRQFAVSATWSNGSTSVPPITWTATGGTVSTSGLYTAGTAAGTYRVIAKHTAGSRADTSAVTITASAATLTSLTMTPPTVSLAPGATQQFAVAARWSNGTTTVPALSYSATGGTVSSSGLYTAGATAGAYRVIVKHQGGTLADTSNVTIATTGGGSAECASPRAGWIWCDDFEANRLSSYFEYDNGGGRFTRNASVGKDGSNGMKAIYTTAAGTSSGALHLAFGKVPSSSFRPVDGGTTVYREVYWRVWVRNQNGWVGGAGDKLSRATSFTGSDWSQSMIAHVWGTKNSVDLVTDPASGTNTAGQVITHGYNDFANLRWLGLKRGKTPLFDAAHVGQWYCVEAHAKLNDAGQSNGLFEFWVNGQSEAVTTGMNWVGNFNAYGINAVFLENYWNDGSPVVQERYLDNFVVSTARIGC